MAAQKDYEIMLKKLKMQVRILQKKEEHAKQQLRTMIKKMRDAGRSYQSKLASKVKIMKGKITEAQASSYAKVAADIERQILKSIETKCRALAAAVGRIEKKHAVKLSSSDVRKRKKTDNVGKTRKAATKHKTKT